MEPDYDGGVDPPTTPPGQAPRLTSLVCVAWYALHAARFVTRLTPPLRAFMTTGSCDVNDDLRCTRVTRTRAALTLPVAYRFYVTVMRSTVALTFSLPPLLDIRFFAHAARSAVKTEREHFLVTFASLTFAYAPHLRVNA